MTRGTTDELLMSLPVHCNGASPYLNGTCQGPGLDELVKAKCLSHDAGCDLWDFAVGIVALRRLGLTESDLRWLLHKSYIEHAYETTNVSDSRRLFDPVFTSCFKRRSCFTLTASGYEYAKALQGKAGDPIHLGEPAAPVRVSFEKAELARPQWNRSRHELSIADIIVKQFRWPARNQESILDAFEEEGWPSDGIYDPLPPEADKDSKQRLRDTIRCLNRYQTRFYLRFRGDGTGQRVLWEFTHEASRDLDVPAAPELPKSAMHEAS